MIPDSGPSLFALVNSVNLIAPDTVEAPVHPASPPTLFPFPHSRACVSGDLPHQRRPHHPSNDSSSGRSSEAMTLEEQEAKAKTQRKHLVEAGKCQLSNITRGNSGLRKTKNYLIPPSTGRQKKIVTPNLDLIANVPAEEESIKQNDNSSETKVKFMKF